MVNFYKDLRFGEDGEKEIAKFLQSKGLDFKGTSADIYPDRTKYFDLVFESKKQEVLVEVKTDKYICDVSDTNNIVFEMSCSGKPSGVSTTQADLWVNYFINKTVDNIWCIKVKELKEFIKTQTNKFHIVNAGTNNKVRLYCLNRLENQHLFKVDTYTGGF